MIASEIEWTYPFMNIMNIITDLAKKEKDLSALIKT